MQSAIDGRSLGAMGSHTAWELSGPGDISHQAGVPQAIFQGLGQLPWACTGNGAFPAKGVECLRHVLKLGPSPFLSAFTYVCVLACICKGLYILLQTCIFSYIHKQIHTCEEGKHHPHNAHSPARSHAPPESKIIITMGLQSILQNTTTNGLIYQCLYNILYICLIIIL